MSWLSQLYCRWPVACSVNATPQEEFAITICCPLPAIINRIYVGPDLVGIVSGDGDGGSGPRSPSGPESGPDFTRKPYFSNLI